MATCINNKNNSSDHKLQNICNDMEELLRTVTEFSARVNQLYDSIDKVGNSFSDPITLEKTPI